MSTSCAGGNAVGRPSDAPLNEQLSDQEIEALLLAENANPPEASNQAPAPHLVESASSAASWVKWLLFIALASEFLVGWFRR
jgi:hypothetical protein